MNRIMLLVLFMLMLGCAERTKKNTRSDTSDILDERITVSDQDGDLFYRVVFEAVVFENDIFHLFYTSNGEEYSSERVVETSVKGSTLPQKISFDLPEEAIPSEIRLDVGTNYYQKPIKYGTLAITFDRRTFSFDAVEFAQSFRSNKFVSFDPHTSVITTTPVDGMYDPHFVSVNIEGITLLLLD